MGYGGCTGIVFSMVYATGVSSTHPGCIFDPQMQCANWEERGRRGHLLRTRCAFVSMDGRGRSRRDRWEGGRDAAGPQYRDTGFRLRYILRRCVAGGLRRRGRAMWELVHQNNVGQRLEGTEAVGTGAAHNGKAGIGSDEPLLNDGIALGAFKLDEVELANGMLLFRADAQHFEQHGVDDIAIVVVPVVVRAIAVDAVALVPLHVAVDGVFDGALVALSGELPYSGFNGCAEEEPVALKWMDDARFFKMPR